MSNLVSQYAEEEYAKDVRNIKGKSKKCKTKDKYFNEYNKKKSKDYRFKKK